MNVAPDQQAQLVLFSQQSEGQEIWNPSMKAFLVGNKIVSNLWVSSYPFQEPTLCFLPCASKAERHNVALHVFDPDGECINRLEVEGPGLPTPLYIDPLLGGSKWEGGMKHGSIKVVTTGFRPYVRMKYSQKIVISCPGLLLSADRTGGFPIRLKEGNKTLLAVTNRDSAPASIRCRFFIGSRAPELLIGVPAHGSRVFGLDHLFAELVGERKDREGIGYIRLSTKSEKGVHLTMFESCTQAAGSTATEKALFIS